MSPAFLFLGTWETSSTLRGVCRTMVKIQSAKYKTPKMSPHTCIPMGAAMAPSERPGGRFGQGDALSAFFLPVVKIVVELRHAVKSDFGEGGAGLIPIRQEMAQCGWHPYGRADRFGVSKASLDGSTDNLAAKQTWAL